MKRTMQWVLTAILTSCGPLLLTSCFEAIGTSDNNPVEPVNPQEELAKETFIHEDWMDRSVNPGDSFF